MMDCKKALTETGGDIDKAIELLREKGLAAAAKKTGRIAAEGLVDTLVEGNAAVIAEINCETDFVANTDGFKELVSETIALIMKEKPADTAALMQPRLRWCNFRGIPQVQNRKHRRKHHSSSL